MRFRRVVPEPEPVPEPPKTPETLHAVGGPNIVTYLCDSVTEKLLGDGRTELTLGGAFARMESREWLPVWRIKIVGEAFVIVTFKPDEDA